ncbi:ribonucleotide reductase subunit alpha [Burkholderiaceae bacterium FT117]|uniref:ribonucleotide reductase subunit alpha n=1 Tax=Zeimonas sediminis TaxID=2944268 RepID=UPI002342CC63|nr:ribonucleotide reductase subunit alpha [Zeimonas sediminis]MCM5570339.1 ribonucleotide reductase subunit alpha [Zeimonas sediminis]
MNPISSFDDLLQAARQQPEPQRLLFVFANVELPDKPTREQRAEFDAGRGGTLAPVMCVDKAADELPDFAALVGESEQFGQPWAVVFAGALSGRDGRAPAETEVEKALERMIESIKGGAIGSMIPFDRKGRILALSGG